MDHLKNPQANATGVGHQNSFNTTKSYNPTHKTTHKTTCTDEPEILRWLSPLEPRTRHEDVRTRRQDGLGSWFLQTDDFIRWSEDKSSKATLFCSGNPGVGKTYLR